MLSCTASPVTLRAAVGLLLSVMLVLLSPFAAAAQSPSPAPPVDAPAPTELTILASYPSVVVDPGGEATFALAVTAPSPERVDLAVDGIPDGWQATFRGGEATVGSVVASTESAPLELRIDVPEEAAPGNVSITIVASGESRSLQLPLDVLVSDTSGGAVALTSEFPILSGDTESPFSFDLELANDTARTITFALEAVGPDGWDVNARPSGEEQAATVQVGAGDSERVTVSAEAPLAAEAGMYPIFVRASGDGQAAEAELGVEITGSYSLTLDAPDGRLNASGTAGSVIDYRVIVANDGTAPLQAVELRGTPPRGWEVAFEPATIEVVEPGAVVEAVAHITAQANAVAGDYDVTLRASTDQADDSIAVRTTIETSTAWGFVGLGVIALVVAGLFLVFRRYGRR